MNIDDAIRAHSSWKIKLSRYLSGHGEDIDISKLSVDNVCDLGQWIHSNDSVLSRYENLNKLREEHKKFHKIASDIAKKKSKNENADVEKLLGPGSDYSNSSMEVIALLQDLKRKMPTL